MPSKIIVPIGAKYNFLTILEDAGVGKGGICIVRCLCDCGKETICTFKDLKSSHTKSCGCIHNKNKYVPCEIKNDIYKSIKLRWDNMISRCYREDYIRYYDYGGRGIKMCHEWRNDFMNFYNWAINNGFKKKLRIDRINNNGDYSPDNCHFVTVIKNNRNKRNTVMIEINGVIKSVGEWAHIKGIHSQSLLGRVNMGWDKSDLFIPIRQKRKTG